MKPWHSVALPRISCCALAGGAALALAGCHTRVKVTPPGTTGTSVLHSTAAHFVDVAESAGLHYRWTIPGPRPLDLRQTIGNGCAFLDYNNSGNLSVLLVGPKLALYRGDGHGHFTDVTHQMGLDQLKGDFRGCAVGDYDNDGFDDLYLSGYHTGVLLHNERGRVFRDVTRQAGLRPQPWGSSCAFADIDGDGRLDLYVANYLLFGPGLGPTLCPYGKRVLTACPPGAYRAEHGVLYRNLGNGRFQDATKAWGADQVSGKALGAAFADYDSSGRQSLAIANDEMPEDLLQNVGGRFRPVGRKSGVAFLPSGAVQGGMGIDWGDYNNDGKLDLVIANFEYQAKPLYQNLGSTFSDVSAVLGLAAPTFQSVSFGVKWLDYDNDGWLDLAFTNGHVQDNIDQTNPGRHYRQRMQLFHNDAGRRFTEVSANAGTAFQKPIVGRGLASGDFDNDGRVDLLAVNSEGTLLLLHNESGPVGHWLEVHLEGTQSNRDGYGARVTVTADGRDWTRFCHADGSFQSSSDKRVHFGLGHSVLADRVRVQWPSGHTDVFRSVSVNRIIFIREGFPHLL